MNAQTGMHFPNDRLTESASHSERGFRDALSVEGRTGKRIPFWARIPGRIFRLRAVSESASRSGTEFWDTVSS